jgi:hypothetical protein
MSNKLRDLDRMVTLAKWAYCGIPSGNYCDGCHILRKDKNNNDKPYCDLRPSIGLIHGDSIIYKGDWCPASVEAKP